MRIEMKYMISLFVVLVLALNISKAAIPVINVPDLPPDEKLEPYEYDEEVYVPKVLEAYQWCVVLETQLNILGVEPNNKTFEPTNEELTDLDLDIIKKYHNQALALEKEVLQAPEDVKIQEIEELRRKVSELKFDILRWKKEVFELTLKTQDIEYYKNMNDDFIIESDSLRLYADSIRYYYYNKMNQKVTEVKEYYETMYSNNRIPLITVSGTANKFRLENEYLETDLSPGAMITLNTHPILKYGKYIDLWAEYVNPEVRSFHKDISGNMVETNWKTNFYSFGVNANFTDLIRTYYFNLGFKVGGGFYWGESDALNLDIPKASWKGELVRLELNLEHQKLNLPVELYGSWTFLFPSKDMTFNEYYGNITNQNTLYNISIGFRINL